MQQNVLITTDKSYRERVSSSLTIIYDGGRSEKNWWPECDRRGIPCVVVFKVGNTYTVKWDFITISQQGYVMTGDMNLYDEIKSVYARYWKLKKRPFHYGSIGRIHKLSLDEAEQCAALVFDILEKYKVKRGA
jgi:hypothetical protein